jgi:hypothetical protein
MNVKDLDFRMDNLGYIQAVDKIDDSIQTRVNVTGIIPNHAEAELRSLPEVVISYL